MEIPSHWDEKHLITFLYISVSVTDFIVTSKETSVLNQNLDNLLKGRYQLSEPEKEAIISEVKSFPIAKDAERIEAIKLLSDKISLSSETYLYVIEKLNEIIHSDKYVAIEEHSLLYYIRLRLNKDY
jgi:hypothetical protein